MISLDGEVVYINHRKVATLDPSVKLADLRAFEDRMVETITLEEHQEAISELEEEIERLKEIIDRQMDEFE